MKLSASPSRAIVEMGTLPLLNTTAFGAVATGSMKAQLALIAAGTINKLGSTPAARPAGARIGISRTVVAVLLVVSVRKVTTSAMVTIMMSGCRVARAVRWAPKAVESPVSTNA